MNLTTCNSLPDPVFHFSNPNHPFPLSTHHRSHFLFSRNCLSFSWLKAPISGQLCVKSLVSSSSSECPCFKLPQALVELSTSSLLLLTLGIFTLSSSAKAPAALAAVNALVSQTVQEEKNEEDSISGQKDSQNLNDKELDEAFEKWKSKIYPLTVPLRVVALKDSVPPAWIKDFIQSQGRRSKLGIQPRGTHESIFSELLRPLKKAEASRSAITADLITLGDSWLDLAIGNAVIEPMQGAEDQDWFRGLTEKWKVYLHRNNEGKIDPEGRIWAVPYRWGSMVIAYKKSKFDRLGLRPVEDWADLWRPELAGRIAMVDSPREVVGAVLKYMGASYNTDDIRKDIPGGISAVQLNLALLAKQVLLFDSTSYLRAFYVGDAWVAVGWSSDILPAAKRMSGVAVVVPKSGASLWADLWAIPATNRCPPMEEVGGRIRGPSPLIHQWLEFCLQPARELPFKQGVFSGASPSALTDDDGLITSQAAEDLPKGAPKLMTNLIAGVPPPEILAKCEFLQPLSESTLSDYKQIISTLGKPRHGLIQQFFSNVLHATWLKQLVFRRENR